MGDLPKCCHKHALARRKRMLHSVKQLTSFLKHGSLDTRPCQTVALLSMGMQFHTHTQTDTHLHSNKNSATCTHTCTSMSARTTKEDIKSINTSKTLGDCNVAIPPGKHSLNCTSKTNTFEKKDTMHGTTHLRRAVNKICTGCTPALHARMVFSRSNT